MLTLVTYQTRTRQNPQMVMSLPLGISQYLGGPWYDLKLRNLRIVPRLTSLHYATSETWLGVLVEHIQSTWSVFIHRWVPTTIHEDYAACINSTKPWYISKVNAKTYCVYIYISKASGDWSHASRSQTTLSTSTWRHYRSQPSRSLSEELVCLTIICNACSSHLEVMSNSGGVSRSILTWS